MSHFFAAAAFLVVILFCGGGNAYASGLSTQSKAEIDYLFSYLKNSGCQFNRNEKWYDASEAVSHLDRKYTYLLEKNMLSSTEDFIAKAATNSSVSGKFYLVKCGNDEPMQSGMWFRTMLEKYRSEKR
ncbi:MAG: DUF5329 domain-containing protein [Betaproteobacteria bacterium]|nr:DUF5329 domain-containing protein [Betaproteobacteria bacterium]